MTFLAELERHVGRLHAMRALDVETDELVHVIEQIDDENLVAVLEHVAAVRTCVDRLGVIAAGVAARPSH